LIGRASVVRPIQSLKAMSLAGPLEATSGAGSNVSPDTAAKR
jgi:hypothetical protein